MRRVEFVSSPANPHVRKISDYFGGLDYKFASLPPEVSFVFLCFTNRCGSNYLAELIASSGQYNLAGEDLNWDTVINHAKQHNLQSFQEYFGFLTRHLRKSERVFIKLATSQVDLLARSGIMDQVLGRSSFILIERSDKLAQAISHALAFATGRFTSLMEGSKDPEQVEFSRTHIDNVVVGLAEQYKQFDLFFGKNGITPFLVIYEQLAEEPSTHFGALARHLGLPAIDIRQEKLRLQQQSSVVNLRWKQLYLSE